MIDGFDPQKCGRRNALAALRFGIETCPFHLMAGSSMPASFLQTPGVVALDSQGDLPPREDVAATLALINGRLPDGAPALTGDDVYIHHCEAASSRFIDDRFAFMGSSTLTNIATDAARGVAFMNSHRTGGYSTPSELPFGKTFAGRYEQYLLPDGQLLERTLVGFYMLRDTAPNGASGPTTDTLDRMINGGVLADVSVGIRPGQDGTTVCSVCRGDYRMCEHYAGTSENMSEEDMEAQRRRGVHRGVASYEMHGWRLGEVSGVYDGAVPGAGFSKGYAPFSSGGFSSRSQRQFAESFGSLLAHL